MTIQILNNGDTLGTQRGKINANFAELDSSKPDTTAVLTKTNTVAYTPSGNYHPATKLYSDSLITNWHSVYNPQGKTSDVYVRANHTGPLDPGVVDQNSNNRFVTDVQIASWDGKEDSIGLKNTAFNKNFGTGSTDVAPGDHSHTKADVGLGNVDNTSDVDKGISTDTQEALDLKADLENDFLDFTPQSPPPDYGEGRFYYDDATKTFVGKSDIPEVSLNMGEEMFVRYVNRTGSTILNGTPLAFGGYDVSAGLPFAVIPIADTLQNAKVGGMATHDIPHDGIGYATAYGIVRDFDTSDFLDGTVVYLSDTVPGGMTATPGPIVTRIGAVLRSSVLEGTLFVSPISDISTPTLLGELNQKVGTMNLTTSYQNIIDYTNGENNGLPVNPTLGLITTAAPGKYRVTFNVTMTIPTSSQSRSITIQLWCETDSHQEVISTISIPKDSTQVSRSFSKLFQAEEAHDFVIRLLASDAMTGVSFDDLSYDIVSEKI